MSPPIGSPSPVNLEQQRKRAKDLRRAHREGSAPAAVRIGRHLPRARGLSAAAILAAPFTLSEAQLVVAREAGFASWPKLKESLEGGGADACELVLDAALAGRDNIVAAALRRDPDLPRRSIYAAAVLADTAAVLAALDTDSALADRAGGSRAWKPLLYLCSSRYRRGETGAARAAIAHRLIALGASPTGRAPGFSPMHGAMMAQDNDLQAIEAAAGRAAGPELVRTLLELGADLTKTTVALLQAVRGGSIEVLRLLLKALPSQVAWQANWAIEESVAAGRKDMTKLLADRVELPAERAILDAIRFERDRETFDILLGRGALSEQRLRRARMAYRNAVRHGNAVAAEALVQWGADASAVTEVDRVLGACIRGHTNRVSNLGPHLSDTDHQMLSWAIRNGRTNSVPLLLQVGVDPDVPDVDGETPLHLAVRASVADTLEMLLAHGASIDEANFEGQTPLEVALTLPDATAREQITNLLLDRGASPARMSPRAPIDEKLRLGGAVDREDPDLLFEHAANAVVSGDLAALGEMLDDEPELVRARSPRLHRATLLQYCGANGVEGARQRTPLNAPAVARLLLERGANVNATCNMYRGGATTLALVLSSCHPLRAGVRIALAEALIRGGAKMDELARAAALGDLNAVQRFFEEHPTPAGDLVRQQIQLAFRWACDFGRTSVAEFLLEKGADLSTQDQDGQTGLHTATLAGHVDTVKLLVSRGSPLEVRNAWNGTVLNHALWAALNHDPNVDYAPIIEVLIDAGAKVQPGSAAWWRREDPLFPASKARIEALLERGEKRNPAD